ncbi:broad-spectrum mercury transporter MerE, partial [Vibrio sp. 2033]
MNSPERMPAETHKPFTGYLWGALAVLTCPCHLPILAIVLAGTTAGAFIGEHWG